VIRLAGDVPSLRASPKSWPKQAFHLAEHKLAVRCGSSDGSTRLKSKIQRRPARKTIRLSWCVRSGSWKRISPVSLKRTRTSSRNTMLVRHTRREYRAGEHGAGRAATAMCRAGYPREGEIGRGQASIQSCPERPCRPQRPAPIAERELVGVVTGDKIDKTRVVTVERRLAHAKYGKS